MAALLQNRPSGSQKPIAKCRPHDAVLSLGTELHLLRNISGRNHYHRDLTLTGLLEPNAPATSLAASPYLVAGKVEGHYRASIQSGNDAHGTSAHVVVKREVETRHGEILFH